MFENVALGKKRLDVGLGTRGPEYWAKLRDFVAGKVRAGAAGWFLACAINESPYRDGKPSQTMILTCIWQVSKAEFDAEALRLLGPRNGLVSASTPLRCRNADSHRAWRPFHQR